MIVTCAARAPVAQNYDRFCDPTLDRDEDLALTSYDHDARRHAYTRVRRRIVEEAPFVTLWFDRLLSVVRDDLHGYAPAHAVTGFWNTWEYETYQRDPIDTPRTLRPPATRGIPDESE